MMKMRRNASLYSVALAVVLALSLLAISRGGLALAAKPSDPDHDVVAMSNGYPSGPHFNLNIHGKKDDYVCDPSPGGGSIFIPEYLDGGGDAEIEYVASKKHDVDSLTVLDRCSSDYDGDPARVQLPKTGIYSDGFWVFARSLAKPNNGKNDPDDDTSTVMFYPDPVVRVCNDGEVDFDGDGTLDDCPTPDSNLVPMGLVTSQGVYNSDGEELPRPRGKVKATDITGLFTWTGFVCDASLDVSGPDGIPDGVLGVDDVPNDMDGDGDIDETDLQIYLSLNCTFYDQEWVFNIADLVVQDQDIVNDGVKLVKIRFYPVATTEFTPDTPKVNLQVLDDLGDDVSGGTVSPGDVSLNAIMSAGTGPTPTGDMNFRSYATMTDCQDDMMGTAGVDIETVTLASGMAQTASLPVMSGVMVYRSFYTPDAASDYYNSASSACVPLAVGITPDVTTLILDSLGGDVTGGMVIEGEMVHAEVTVSDPLVLSVPTGTVDISLFTTMDCSGASVDESGIVLDGSGVASSTPVPAVVGFMSYMAHYNGENADFFPVSGSCVSVEVLVP